MILNIYDSNTYSLTFDIADLNKYNINILSLCSDSQKLPIYINKLLKNDNFSNECEIKQIKFITFNFKIFKLTFCINQF